MKRISNGIERPEWRQRIYNQGLVYWPTKLPDGTVKSYWSEAGYYSFALWEIEQLEQDAKILFEMFVDAGDAMVQDREFMLRMGIPDWAIDRVIESWNREPTWGVYGRIDVRYAGNSHLSAGDPTFNRLKLYEFNADTPTSLLESAIIQWLWHQETGQGDDQWNDIFEQLVKAWKRNGELFEEQLGHKPVVHFACTNAEESGEDVFNVRCMQETCEAAGFQTKFIFMEDIVWSSSDGKFYDADGNHLDVVFKLYPWEWMLEEKFGKQAVNDADYVGTQYGGTIWIEDFYKCLWSNKALLVMLWKLFGNDPELSQLLLPTYWENEKPDWLTSYAVKPLLGREGANVEIWVDGKCVQKTDGEYTGPRVVQALAYLPTFPTIDEAGNSFDDHVVLGLWYIDGHPAGMGIRASRGAVTDNLSDFMPHVIDYDERDRLESEVVVP